MSSLAPVGQGEQGRKVIYCLWSMERFVGRGAVNLSYPVKAISITSVVFVVCWSDEFPALPFGWGFWAFIAIKPERSEVERVLRERRSAGVPTGIKQVPHCHQPPPGCASLGYSHTPSSGVRGFSCSRQPGPYPVLPVPAPTSCHSQTARVCLPNIVLWVRKTHQ